MGQSLKGRPKNVNWKQVVKDEISYYDSKIKEQLATMPGISDTFEGPTELESMNGR